MIKYVCGLYFSTDLESVTLIEKLKPEWQYMRWNGLGGKIEGDESPEVAMAREFYEECGIKTNWYNWLNLPDKTEQGENWICYFLCAFGDEKPKTMETEKVETFLVEDVYSLPLIENLRHIIPEAISILDFIIKNYGISNR